MAVHDPGRTTGFPCKQCGIVCPNMPSLLEHMDCHLQEEEERKFKCDECGRGYRHAGSLANHKKTHDVGSFRCNICGKENSNALALKSHLRSHTSPKKYSCAECGKAFRLATQLATHERVHLTRRTKERSYRKVDAEYGTHDNSSETEDGSHHLNEQSTDFEISMENEDKADVYNTQSETTDDAANRPFRCDLCDKSYIHHRSLTNHKKTHQVGMFECTVCFKLFNNMAALYSHQRTHKGRGGTGPSSVGGSYTGATLDHFSPQSQDAQANFCHLCQVLFPSDKEFQEHIQMHNSSSVSFGIQDNLTENHSISYDNSISSPESNFYASHMNNVPSVSSLDNHIGFDQPHEHIRSNGNMYSDCSNNQTPSSNSTQGESPIMDTHILNPVLAHAQNSDDANEMQETSTVDSSERPFKCHICGKTYRHSGSLINHKRSHQVGIYQCSICRKNYPHLAALKSHLRLHKGQSSSFSLNAEGDWLSTEPLTLENQQSCFSSQMGEEDEDMSDPVLGIDQENMLGHSNGALYHEQYHQDFSRDMSVHLPHNEHLMQRHMCADCGETFADIAGIKSHSCPLLQQQHETTSSDYDSHINFQESNGHCTIGDPGDDVGFPALNGIHEQHFFQQSFHDSMGSDQPNGGMESHNAEEEEEEEEEEEDDDDGELFHCSICGNNYTSMRALRSHIRGHTQSHSTPVSSGPSSMSSQDEAKDDEPGEMMICSTCGESFANRQDLIAHQLAHATDQVDNGDGGGSAPSQISNSDGPASKEEAQSIICGSCGIFCTSYHHLENHGCTAGTKDESVDCKEEAKEDQRKATGRVRGTLCAEDRQYKCDQCGRSYRHAGSLLNHKKSHKTGVFKCHVCQKRFYNLLALKNHQRSHFDVKRHTCHECGKAFKIQKQLQNHLRRHKENQAKIQELNSQIQALMQMNGTKPEKGTQHYPEKASPATSPVRRCKRAPGGKSETMVKSEDTSEERPFACDQCGRTYRHAGSLVNHRNSHKTGEYYCSVCNNTYSNQLAMKNHLRTHFAFKKHCCQKCGKGFRGKKQLMAHVCVDIRKDGAAGRRGVKPRAVKCKKCRLAFASMDQLAAHVCDGSSGSGSAQTPVKEERAFKCNICNRSYRHAGSLLNHKNTHKTGHFSCTFCSKPFTNPMALRNHTRIHTQKKKYVCLTCGKAFRLASILHNHQKVHNRVASHFSCSACGKSFQGRSGLKRHRCRRGQGGARAVVQQSDRGDKCFMCDLCGRSYRHAGSLLNHKKTHSENLHHCTLCLQTFPDPLTLQIHSQMRRHCCPECGKTFCLVSHLQSHMEVHAKDRPMAGYQQGHHHEAHHQARGPYPPSVGEPVEDDDDDDDDGDDLCWDSGITRTLGRDAAPKQSPPPLSYIAGSVANPQDPDSAGAEEKSHVCEHCGRTYRHAGSLLNHKNSHKTGSFFCSVCQKEFTNLMALKNHRRIHTEPKRYQCLECGKAFRVSTQLICHRRIHTKEKPFACLLCDKSFSSKSNLRHHQKMHQSNEAYDASFGIDSNTFMDLDMGSFL